MMFRRKQKQIRNNRIGSFWQHENMRHNDAICLVLLVVRYDDVPLRFMPVLWLFKICHIVTRKHSCAVAAFLPAMLGRQDVVALKQVRF